MNESTVRSRAFGRLLQGSGAFVVAASLGALLALWWLSSDAPEMSEVSAFDWWVSALWLVAAVALVTWGTLLRRRHPADDLDQPLG